VQKAYPPKVVQVPKILKLKENSVRTEFFAVEKYLKLKDALPDHLELVLTMGYHTSTRKMKFFLVRGSR